MNAGQVERDLAAGLDALDVADAGSLVPRLFAYLGLLERWNRTHNLTAVRDPAEMVPRHILDSLAVLPYLHGERIVDVGSGAGLPGLPLAMARPKYRFLLLDSASKRIAFLNHAIARLGLSNVTIAQARVKDYDGKAGFDTVISRAFSSLADFVSWSGHLCAPGGRLLAMKGRIDPGEVANLPAGWQLDQTRRLRVPGLDGERHLLEIVPRSAG
ncbi:MAG: 16S rRNA (guanine(527)-N(7))-methyltransferase RsmG [Gammaproteobacteria bacterium]